MDDLRDALSSAFDSTEPASTTEPASAVPATTVAESAAEQTDPVEVNQAPVAGDSAGDVGGSGAVKTIDEVVAANTGETKQPEKSGAPDPRIDRAPASWKGDAKKVWNELPLQARQEVIRRERETSRVLQETAQDRQRVASMQQVLAPHMDHINSAYRGNPLAAIDGLLGLDKALSSGDTKTKAQLVARMVKHFGVDLPTLDAMLAGQEAPEARQQSQIEELLERRLAPFQVFIQQQQEQQLQQRRAQEQGAVQTVSQMANDPAFPYFNDVREDMADLIDLSIKRGSPIGLVDAYHRAVRMNDSTFQSSAVRETSQAATHTALAAHREAQKAKGASVSVSGSPSATGTNAGNPADLRGTIATAMESMGGRV